MLLLSLGARRPHLQLVARHPTSKSRKISQVLVPGRRNYPEHAQGSEGASPVRLQSLGILRHPGCQQRRQVVHLRPTRTSGLP